MSSVVIVIMATNLPAADENILTDVRSNTGVASKSKVCNCGLAVSDIRTENL